MEFQQLIETRYSMRSFSGAPVEEEKLTAILEAANLAPTAKNLQPQRIYVLRSKEALATALTLTQRAQNASAVLVFTVNTAEAWSNPFTPDYSSPEVDGSIVCTHAMLKAAELGVGSCWVGSFRAAEVKKALSLPDEEKVIAILPLGYPSDTAQPAPAHSVRKPLSATVKYL